MRSFENRKTFRPCEIMYYIAALVMLPLLAWVMHQTITLDYQLRIAAKEVGDVLRKLVLTSELEVK